MSNIGFTSIIQIHQSSQSQSLVPYPTLSVSETWDLVGEREGVHGGFFRRTPAKYTQGAINFCHRET